MWSCEETMSLLVGERHCPFHLFFFLLFSLHKRLASRFLQAVYARAGRKYIIASAPRLDLRYPLLIVGGCAGGHRYWKCV